MGRSSPPFMYERPSTYSFNDPVSRPFNPKVITQASWTREPSRPKPNGPLIKFHHPDSYVSLPNGRATWEPMSPHTKSRVKYGRLVLLFLRILALLGALGSLFCAIVIKGAGTTIIWMIRAAPAVAAVHNLYGVYHLCRSPISRPPASQASYMLFASTVDVGVLPFYALVSFMAYGQWTTDAYNWNTLFDSPGMTSLVAEIAFIIGTANSGLHLVSLSLSIFLAAIFRQITKLPPDMNPLEDNLTSRAHKRNESEITDKHCSQVTIDSDIPPVDYALVGSARSVPFMHTRVKSSVDSTASASSQSQSGGSFSAPRHSRIEQSVAGASSRAAASCPQSHLAQHQMASDMSSLSSTVTATAAQYTQVAQLPQGISNRFDSVSPSLDNWIAYPSRSPSPIQLSHIENHQSRPSSSIYSRSKTTASSNSGLREWIGYSQIFGKSSVQAISQTGPWGYTSLSAEEYYGNVEDAHELQHPGGHNDGVEQDIGESYVQIYHDRDDEMGHSPKIHPLAMNPPTPQPRDDLTLRDNGSAPRPVLADISDTSLNSLHVAQGTEVETSQLCRSDLVSDNEHAAQSTKSDRHGIPANVTVGKKRSAWRRRSGKLVSSKNGSNQRKLSRNDGDHLEFVPLDNDRDRKGRVVSNSGVDITNTARHILGSTPSLSYGNYFAGLGVGRRRDVSGKIAEEGRAAGGEGGTTTVSAGSGSVQNCSSGKAGAENQAPIRAAGWARFAGL